MRRYQTPHSQDFSLRPPVEQKSFSPTDLKRVVEKIYLLDDEQFERFIDQMQRLGFSPSVGKSRDRARQSK